MYKANHICVQGQFDLFKDLCIRRIYLCTALNYVLRSDLPYTQVSLADTQVDLPYTQPCA